MAFDLLSLLSQVPSMISNFSGSAQPYRKQQEQLAGQQQQISQAMLDNNNPLYQAIYGQYKQQNQNNMAQSIAEAQGQNRMNANMGRTPLFSNERGSENIFRTMMQQYQNGGVQADQQTRSALGGAMGGANTALQSYNTLTPFSNMQTAQQLQPYKDIYSLLSGKQSSNGLNGNNISGNPLMNGNNFLMPNTGSSGAGNYTNNQNQQPQQQSQNLWGYQYP